MHVGTDCTGLGAICIALQALRVAFRHIFGSEIDDAARRQTAVVPEIFYRDVCARSCRDPPCVDVYVCGFPCQPFSQAGLGRGFLEDRGQVFFHIYRYIKYKQPRSFILENVQGLESAQSGECFRQILLMLWSLETYNIWFDLLDTREHGVPHSRPRWYFVGILASEDRGTFQMPAPIPCPSIERFLQPRLGRPSDQDLPPTSQSVARLNVMCTLHELRLQGRDPLEECWLIDCDSSHGRSGFMLECSPCITRSRARGHWITNRGRRLSTAEAMSLQGIRCGIALQTTEVQFCQILGNSMSVNILERLLCRLLPAVGLWEGFDLRDPHG